MLTILKQNLPFNHQYVKIDLKNLREPNKQKLNVNKYRIYVKDDDVNKCREVLPVIIYFAGYCCYAVLKKIKCNNCKCLISGWDNVEEKAEINSYFQNNRGSLLYSNNTTTNFHILIM